MGFSSVGNQSGWKENVFKTGGTSVYENKADSSGKCDGEADVVMMVVKDESSGTEVVLNRKVATVDMIVKALSSLHLTGEKHCRNAREQVTFLREQGYSVPKNIWGLTVGVAR